MDAIIRHEVHFYLFVYRPTFSVCQTKFDQTFFGQASWYVDSQQNNKYRKKRVTGISQEKSFFVYRNRQGYKPQHDVCSK